MKPQSAPPGAPRRVRPSQRPSLHWVLQGEFPSFDGTMALCDSLCPSRRASLPSRGDTLRCACGFAPGGPGHQTAGLGFIFRSPLPDIAAWSIGSIQGLFVLVLVKPAVFASAASALPDEG